MYKEVIKSYNKENDGFNGNYYGYVVSTEEENLKNWLQKEINDDGYVYNIIKNKTEEIFILKNLNIDEDFQGKGFGKKLLEEAMEEAEVPTILLCDIGESQKSFFDLEIFYEKQGFETILNVKNYPLMVSEDIGFDIKHELLPYQDKIFAKEWLNANSFEELEFNTQKEPIKNFEQQIIDMRKYGDDQDDERIDTIKDLLESGEKPWPIYVDSAHDDFVMEGRHKMVAFYELGIEEIDVCRVTFKEKPKPEIKSRRRNRP